VVVCIRRVSVCQCHPSLFAKIHRKTRLIVCNFTLVSPSEEVTMSVHLFCDNFLAFCKYCPIRTKCKTCKKSSIFFLVLCPACPGSHVYTLCSSSSMEMPHCVAIDFIATCRSHCQQLLGNNILLFCCMRCVCAVSVR